MADNTFATPFCNNRWRSAATSSIHSTTKYLGGHSDVVGGVLVANDEELRKRLAHFQNSCGGTPGPMDCFLVLRGTKTLHVRMERHCENALARSPSGSATIRASRECCTLGCRATPTTRSPRSR
jgi:cystathionine gamma-lyase